MSAFRFRVPEEQFGTRRSLAAVNEREELMRTYLLSIAAVTLFTIPTPAFSKDIRIGPGGAEMGSSYGHHRYYNRYEGLYDRYESERCRALRQVCMNKEEELAEKGMGSCRRFRELCD
jgi:hypothetical protein